MYVPVDERLSIQFPNSTYTLPAASTATSWALAAGHVRSNTPVLLNF